MGVEQLRRVITRWQPDVVHTHAGVPSCAAAVVRQSGIDFTLVNHVYSWGVGRPAWMTEMDLSGHRQADAVICSADAYEQQLLDGGVRRARLVKVNWGLAPASLDGAARSTRRTRSPRIGLVGRIEPRKGQLDLVRGFALVQRSLPTATLDLVGPVADEEYAERIRQEIVRRGLQRSVTLRGRVRSVPAIVSTWDLCVSLSSDEGQGLAILEAMALGVPVAARPVAGVEDYFRPGVNGIAVRSSRARDVAEAVVERASRSTASGSHGASSAGRRPQTVFLGSHGSLNRARLRTRTALARLNAREALHAGDSRRTFSSSSPRFHTTGIVPARFPGTCWRRWSG